MSGIFSNNFNFNKGHRRAVFIMSLLIIILVVVRVYFINAPENTGITQRMREKVKEINAAVDTIDVRKSGRVKKYQNRGKNHISIKPEAFDPNKATARQLMAAGLSRKQAYTIVKYIKSGGSFKYKEDLKKINCISDSDYYNIEKYILLDNIPSGETVQNASDTKMPIIELNGATAEDLLEINGIGPYTAKSIIRYRTMLGGYYSVEQLKEVYGIDSLKYENIRKFFIVNRDSLKTIDLNKSDFYSLKRHPYISKKQAFEITNHIKYVEKFHSVEELKKLKSINDSVYEKIYHYFVVY